MANVKGYICFFADYFSNEFVSVSDETFIEIERIYATLESGVLDTPNNFIGITDHRGNTIQFYVNQDYSVDVDIPVPEKEGSFTKILHKSQCIEIIRQAGTDLSEIDIPNMCFKKWSL